MTDRHGVIAPRAENLTPGVNYFRGWAEARRGAESLAEQLAALGLENDFPGLAADVNVWGDGLVRLGAVRPDAALLLARLIEAGTAVQECETRPHLSVRNRTIRSHLFAAERPVVRCPAWTGAPAPQPDGQRTTAPLGPSAWEAWVPWRLLARLPAVGRCWSLDRDRG
jgi:hypothetical protein